MNLLESFRVALRALLSNKLRAVLTMLGVIIGVAAVILLVSIGSGVENQVTGQIEGLGSNLLFVFAGNVGQGGGGPGTVTKRFQLSDADLLRSRLDVADAVVPVVQGPITVRAGTTTFQSEVSASTADAVQVFTHPLASGRFYDKSEVDGGVRVVVLGSTIADAIGGTNAVGQTVTVGGQPFNVIGVLTKIGGGLAGNQDDVVYMPVTTAQQLLGSTDLSLIAVKVRSIDQMDLARTEIAQALKPAFGTQYTIFSQQQTLAVFSTLLGTLTIALAGIAGISLLVGGIGIMNIMLVSVSERTREIGIRKSLGARNYDILLQFVIEAVTLSVLGGIAGIVIGSGGAALLRRLIPTAVSVWSVLLAFGFSVVVGVFFGVYPAWKASRMEPVEALRYE